MPWFSKKTTYGLIQKSLPWRYHLQGRVAAKLEHTLRMPPLVANKTADRMLKNLRKVNRHLTPRIRTVVWKLWWNAWPTHSRCGRTSSCSFCDGQRESMAHFVAGCPQVLALWKHVFWARIPNKYDLLFADNDLSESTLLTFAACIYATYCVMNSIHHASLPLTKKEQRRLFVKYLGFGIQNGPTPLVKACSWQP